MNKKYFTNIQRKKAHKIAWKKYYESHKEYFLNKNKNRKISPEKQHEYWKRWYYKPEPEIKLTKRQRLLQEQDEEIWALFADVRKKFGN